MRFAAIIVAAGSGARIGGELAKQWRPLAGRPVIRWSFEALLAAGAEQLVVVLRPGDEPLAEAALAGLPRWSSVHGGRFRADSVRAGLEALTIGGAEAVLVHDAARPFVTAAHVTALLNALQTAEGAILALPLSDTLKRGDGERRIVDTPSRERLWRAQTPQAFRRETLVRAYASLPADVEPTDDAQVVERIGVPVALVPGDPRLNKITYEEDFAMAETLAGGARITRAGMGFDAHRWGPGASVWLCGVEIAHTQTLIGHSDADAGLHALTDALLGAIGQGDIGDHFPPSDPKWRGASSDRFLVHAAELVAAAGGRIVNVDVTLICEQPKIKPHREAMRARVAELLALPLDRVSVKATTTEMMGFTGRGEGLAAQAIATVETPA